MNNIMTKDRNREKVHFTPNPSLPSLPSAKYEEPIPAGTISQIFTQNPPQSLIPLFHIKFQIDPPDRQGR